MGWWTLEVSPVYELVDNSAAWEVYLARKS